MSNQERKCFSKDHEESPSFYCAECKIYMCNNCKELHSKLFKCHKEYNLDEDIDQIFNGYCKEKNHLDKLEYYCKTHNKLCCSACIAKIKKKDKGQHTNCEVYVIEDIKDNKKDILQKNITYLEDLSKNIETSIKELKEMFKKINESKDALKLKIQGTFTKIKDQINEREDELLLEVDKLYEETYVSDNVIRDLDKLPNRIKSSLDKGQTISKDWEKENKLNSLIYECINIENNLDYINKVNQIMKKSKNEMNTHIKFFPEEKMDISQFLSKIVKFGKIYKDNELNESDELEIMIKSNDKEEKNHILFELNKISYEKYNQYFSKKIKYEEDEIVFTIFLEGKDSNSLNSMFEIFDKSKLNNNGKIKFSMRKENNKLLLDFKINSKDIDDNLLKYLYNLYYNNIEISIILKSNLDLNKVLKMSGYDFFVSLFSNMLSAKIKGLKELLKTSLQKRKKIRMQMNNVEKNEEKNNINNEEINLKNEKENINNKKKEDNKLMGLKNMKKNNDDELINLESKNEEKMKIINDDEINDQICEDDLNGIINMILFISIFNKIKVNYLPEEILKFIVEIFEKTKEDLNVVLKEIIKNGKSFITFLSENLKDIFNYIKLDKCLITILFMKHKFGLALDINSIGLSNLAHELIEMEIQEEEKEQEGEEKQVDMKIPENMKISENVKKPENMKISENVKKPENVKIPVGMKISENVKKSENVKIPENMKKPEKKK